MLQTDFTKAAKKAAGMSDDAFIDAILAERPDLVGQMVYVPEQGGCAHTVIIGDEVFKTARFSKDFSKDTFEHVITSIERERDILRYLKGKAMPVPELTYDEGKGFLFFGMSRMQGQSLAPDDVQKMRVVDKEKLAKQLASICIRLSDTVPVEDAKNMNLDAPLPGLTFEPERFRESLADPEVQKILGDDYDFYKKAIEMYIDRHQEKYADSRLVFMQGDLNPGNIFYDPKEKNITGLFDFGACRLTWPEEGFASFCMTYPTDFVDRFLKEYSRQQATDVTRKDLYLWLCVRVVLSISDGLRSNKPENWREILANMAPRLRKKIESLSADKPIQTLPVQANPKTP